MPTIKKRGSASKHQPQEEIRSIVHHVVEYVAAHSRIFTVIAVTLVAALVLGAGYSLMQSAQEQKAAPLLASAYDVYSNPQGGNPDYSRALELYRDVQKKYSSTTSGAIAQYYVGNCLMGLGRPDEALKEYQLFVRKYSSDKFILGLVYERMGHAYRALGKQTEAIQAFEQSDSLIGPGASTLELAKLYEASGNTVESQKKYKLIADKLAGTAWAMEAMGKVQKISSLTPPPAAVQK